MSKFFTSRYTFLARMIFVEFFGCVLAACAVEPADFTVDSIAYRKCGWLMRILDGFNSYVMSRWDHGRPCRDLQSLAFIHRLLRNSDERHFVGTEPFHSSVTSFDVPKRPIGTARSDVRMYLQPSSGAAARRCRGAAALMRTLRMVYFDGGGLGQPHHALAA
jgi:hypothetical protein